MGLGSFIDTKDILKLVVGKLSSQILLFSIAIIVLILIAYSIWGSDGMIPTILIVVIFLVGAFGYLFVEQKQKVEQGESKVMNKVIENKMNNISNISSETPKGESKLNIELGVDKATSFSGSRDISFVPTSSGDKFKVGDKININFKVSKPSYLTLLNIGTSGKLTILFPNKIYSNNFIEANKKYEIPGNDYGFEYQLQGPSGKEKLKAIVTEEKINIIESQLSADGSLFKTVEPQAAARDISILEKKVESIPNHKWNEAYFEFEVAE
jgi:hypothetical protein